MEGLAEAKSVRLLEIYSQLVNGELLKKSDLALQYHVSPRSIQRDMDSLRCFFVNQSLPQDIIYDRSANGYRLINGLSNGLSNSEILAVCKILLESRSMRKGEMFPILDKLMDCAVPRESKKAVSSLIANEKLHYDDLCFLLSCELISPHFITAYNTVSQIILYHLLAFDSRIGYNKGKECD